jgi:hypothetical protein
MSDEVTNWQALLSTEQNRQTEPSSEILIFHVMSDEVTNWQALLSTDHNRQTEPY